MRTVYAAGQRDFGESYAQELAEKAAALADLPELRWHFLGPLQRNKAKLVARHACSVHALESARPAAALGALDAFVQVNVAGEASKHGVTEAELGALLDELGRTALRVVGLMTLPPPDLRAAGAAFGRLAELARAHGLPRLSMGMSDDLELAVAAGATDLRIGSAIFGERPQRSPT